MSGDILLSGEKLLWKGAPEPGIHFRLRDIFISLFGLFFFGFSLIWEFMVIFIIPSPLYFPFFGIPFVIVGAYLVGGRYFWDAHKRGRTAYTLTDRRALIQVNSLGRSQKSVSLHDLDEVMLDEHNNGLGSIALGRDVTTGSGDHKSTSFAPRFEFIKDAKRVYQMIENARNKAAD